jgi:hypothetical protein
VIVTQLFSASRGSVLLPPHCLTFSLSIPSGRTHSLTTRQFF